ncbi:MAG TPA: DJ-1 family glyoxalase III [Methanotrichaceae archaeon]|nr:DJ-1 family glyoxalase III [Methanotrichaceae archaeon]
MKILVPLAEGFEEIESITVIDILRRADLEVITASLVSGPVEGSHKIKVVPDASLDDIKVDDIDAIILPGGYPGFVNLESDQRVIKAIRDMHQAGKCVAAICLAPAVLMKAGVLEGRKATISPYGKNHLTKDIYADDRVVVDGNLITSKSPGTAMEFSLKLVETLAGEEKAIEIAEQVLAKV